MTGPEASSLRANRGDGADVPGSPGDGRAAPAQRASDAPTDATDAAYDATGLADGGATPSARPSLASAPRADDADADLLRRHVAGDPSAFGELFDTHRHRLWRLATSLLGDPTEAEDVLQEAMLSAHRKAADFEGRSSVATWLHRIVVNAALSQLRRRKARPTVPMPTDPHGADLEPADPHDRVTERDLHLDVVQALGALPTEMRCAVVLVDVHGYPVAEVARLLEVPEGTVKSRCARARARLAVLLGHLRPGNRSAGPAVSLEDQQKHDPHSARPISEIGDAPIPRLPRGRATGGGTADSAEGGDRP